MTRIGLSLSGEQHGPNELVELASRAETAGFDFVLASDHFHPWLDVQDESAFVWTTLGGVARETDGIEVGTGVACPLIRVHPAVVAQAAATTATMLGDRFFLGVGTGERLNEHVLGDRWPPHHVRLEMLEEAVDVMRTLWSGGMHSHDGEHYTVENAQIFTRPEDPPPVHVAASGPETAELAGSIGDGLVSTSPDEGVVERFRANGDEDDDRPRFGQLTACYADDEETAADVAHEHWRNGLLPGELGQELATPRHFEQATALTDPGDVSTFSLGPDPGQYVESIERYAEAGFDHVSIHQVNPDADGFFELCEDEVLPAVS